MQTRNPNLPQVMNRPLSRAWKLRTRPSAASRPGGGVYPWLVQHRLTLGLLATAAVFGLSSLPISTPPRVPGLDKVVHVTEYLLVGLAYLNLTTRGLRRLTLRAVGWYFTVLLAVGACDEWYQSLIPGRVSDWRDLLADAGGGTLALLVGLGINLRLESLTARTSPREWWEEPPV